MFRGGPVYWLVFIASFLPLVLYQNAMRDGEVPQLDPLGMKMARLYRRQLFHVYPDNRTTATPLNDVRAMLNFKLRKKNDPRDWPFRRMHFRDSKASLPLQLTDIATGALAFKMNGHYEAEGASEAKKALCDHILRRANLSDVMRSTDQDGRFTIWHRLLR